MKIAIVTLLQTALAMMNQEAADAQAENRMDDASAMIIAAQATQAVIAALTARSDAEVDTAVERVSERLRERGRKK